MALKDLKSESTLTWLHQRAIWEFLSRWFTGYYRVSSCKRGKIPKFPEQFSLSSFVWAIQVVGCSAVVFLFGESRVSQPRLWMNQHRHPPRPSRVAVTMFRPLCIPSHPINDVAPLVHLHVHRPVHLPVHLLVHHLGHNVSPTVHSSPPNQWYRAPCQTEFAGYRKNAFNDVHPPPAATCGTDWNYSIWSKFPDARAKWITVQLTAGFLLWFSVRSPDTFANLILFACFVHVLQKYQICKCFVHSCSYLII